MVIFGLVISNNFGSVVLNYSLTVEQVQRGPDCGQNPYFPLITLALAIDFRITKYG